VSAGVTLSHEPHKFAALVKDTYKLLILSQLHHGALP
jgi:hypothetical protein